MIVSIGIFVGQQVVGQEDRAARFGGYFEHVLCIAIENMYLCVPVGIFCSMYDFRFGGYFEHVLCIAIENMYLCVPVVIFCSMYDFRFCGYFKHVLCIASVVPLNLQQNMYLGGCFLHIV